MNQDIKQTLEDKLQQEWLKTNKPNSYFDTVTDKRADKLIGVGVSYTDKNKKQSDVIIKRRSTKDANGDLIHHYFTNSSKVFTYDEVLIAKDPS